MSHRKRKMAGLATGMIFGIVVCAALVMNQERPNTQSYIVQGHDLNTLKAAVQAVDGEITHELGVIRAVGADLTAAEVAVLRAHPDVRRIYENGSVETAGKGGGKDGGGANDDGVNASAVLNTHYASLVNADALHATGIDGSGIGMAVLDTGLWRHDGIAYDNKAQVRIKAVYDAINNEVKKNVLAGDDFAGHGSHVASIAVSSLMTDAGQFNGIAPGAHLVSVQAFDANGNGTYADVIRAIDWVVKNKSKHAIRVLNLSFSAEARSHYWDDPLNQAVMTAWQNEIFVVTAAGNRGPEALTIGVPGNVPYVLTVGAMSDNYTPADGSDDILATFSTAGPTVEGFVKPEVLAPGGHVLGLMPKTASLAETYPEFHEGGVYFTMSGTSQPWSRVLRHWCCRPSRGAASMN